MLLLGSPPPPSSGTSKHKIPFLLLFGSLLVCFRYLGNHQLVCEESITNLPVVWGVRCLVLFLGEEGLAASSGVGGGGGESG